MRPQRLCTFEGGVLPESHEEDARGAVEDPAGVSRDSRLQADLGERGRGRQHPHSHLYTGGPRGEREGTPTHTHTLIHRRT